MSECKGCHKTIDTKKDFYFVCEHCDAVFCGDCGIDADTDCPICGGAMEDKNENV